MKKSILLIAITTIGLLIACSPKPEPEILVFSKTAGFRHASIESGQVAIQKLGEKNGFQVTLTEDASLFQEKELKKFHAVVFLNTTEDVLNDNQQLEFQRFIQAGGGFVGIHAAADTEYDWPWYGKLVGAYFNGHPSDPNVRAADIQCVHKEHMSTAHLPETWHRSDEWYNYKDINDQINVLLNLDENSYEGGTNGANHPIAWYHEYDGGRSWYTGGGHTNETFEEEDFLKHLLGGIKYAIGEGKPVDFAKSTVAPQENRFVKHNLVENLKEPMELVLLPDDKILFVERKGAVKVYDKKSRATTTIHQMEVWTKFEDGLLGAALDPQFEENHWIYFFYSDPDEVDQNISRFQMAADYMSLDTLSEVVVLEIPTQRDECCHSGGSLEFDDKGNLYISVGDDTNPFKSNGYSPSDTRAGRKPFDALRSSANTMDLRGKILRITPQPDGSYTTPADNLFPDGKAGRPEIYVMGCRNPFRIAIDNRTGYLYWGDVGPDANRDSTEIGPKGHDEVNQARKAGFFGWPMFVGNNKPYYRRDFAKQVTYEAYDPLMPMNQSPNNTGAVNLPPAQSAFIWYPYSKSEEFPLVGNGGRNAMAGPVFYVDDYEENAGRFPAYYNDKLLTYDWMRGFIMAVTMTEEGDFVSMERFMPSTKFSNPTDMVFSDKGDLYLLEYGTKWFSQNLDARLVHIEYVSGNRKPAAEFEADKTIGATPLLVNFDATPSIDFDDDPLQYEWYFTSFDAVQSTEKQPSFTFETPGTYEVYLRVTDTAGEQSEQTMTIYAGNDMPQLAWQLEGNQSFYFDEQPLTYQVVVSDKEDGTIGNGIAAADVAVTIDYLEKGYDVNEISMGHQTVSAFAAGQGLMEASDCKTCHQMQETSIGPNYIAIAERYQDDPEAVQYLANKIINGGGGVWGERAMAAHPTLQQEEAEQIAQYILSLSEAANNRLPAAGSYAFETHDPTNIEGTYILTASYTDKGSAKTKPLTTQQMLVLRHPTIAATAYTEADKASRFTLDEETSQGKIKEEIELVLTPDGSAVLYQDIDLTGITSIKFNGLVSPSYLAGGKIVVRTGAKDGPIIGETTVNAMDGFTQAVAILQPTTGKQALYLTFESLDEAKPVIGLISLEFSNAQLEG